MRFPVRSTLAFVIPILLLIWCTTPSVPAELGADAALLARVNRVRAEHHLIALEPWPELAAVARAHGEELVRRGALDHVNAAGENPLQRAQAAGLSGFSLLAENLGRSDVAADRLDAIVAGWLASPTHRENLLGPAFNRAGTAVLRAPGAQTLVVQLYASMTSPR